MADSTDPAAVIEDFLNSAEIEWEPGTREGEFVASLPGEKKLKTVVSLLVRQDVVRVAAFVIRRPDEDHARFYRYLLTKNLKLPGFAFATDTLGDVYLVGTMAAAALDAAQLDQALGVVLSAADGSFNDLLAIGFISGMRKEWQWRTSRGESTSNLEAFRHLLDPQGPE